MTERRIIISTLAVLLVVSLVSLYFSVTAKREIHLVRCRVSAAAALQLAYEEVRNADEAGRLEALRDLETIQRLVANSDVPC